MSREVIKVKEYKEKMYFEAVQEILDKLADPKMKGSAKANYQRQLKDLDPEGKIVKYLNGEADKPDLTSFLEKNRFIYSPQHCLYNICDRLFYILPPKRCCQESEKQQEEEVTR